MHFYCILFNIFGPIARQTFEKVKIDHFSCFTGILSKERHNNIVKKYVVFRILKNYTRKIYGDISFQRFPITEKQKKSKKHFLTFFL